MRSIVRGAGLALFAAIVANAVPASAEIQPKIGCDGHWVASGDGEAHSYMVCDHRGSLFRGRAALAHRLHVRRLAHVKPHKVAVRVAFEPRQTPVNRDIVVAAATPLRRDLECVILSCPQPIFTGVGF